MFRVRVRVMVRVSLGSEKFEYKKCTKNNKNKIKGLLPPKPHEKNEHY